MGDSAQAAFFAPWQVKQLGLKGTVRFYHCAGLLSWTFKGSMCNFKF